MQFPDRTPEAEDAFVDAMSASDDTEELMRAIDDAMRERRPHLAARLVGLLDDHVEVTPGSPIERARRAASLLVVDGDNVKSEEWDELEQAMILVRMRQIRRIRNRLRRSSTGEYRRDPRDRRR